MIKKNIPTIVVVLITILFTIFFSYCFIRLAFYSKYPSKDKLLYEDYTFIQYKLYEKKGRHGTTRRYEIYVKELHSPILIDDIVFGRANEDVLNSLVENDIISASVKKNTNKIYAYEIIYNEKFILHYEDYLDKHESNETVGIIVTGIMVCIGVGFLVAEIIYCKKNGSLDGIPL